MDEQLRNIVERLESHRQAATYKAVAGLVGANYRNVMSQEQRNHRNSWVVNKKTRRPTGYKQREIHPKLASAIIARGVIETPKDLDDWLQQHP